MINLIVIPVSVISYRGPFVSIMRWIHIWWVAVTLPVGRAIIID